MLLFLCVLSVVGQNTGHLRVAALGRGLSYMRADELKLKDNFIISRKWEGYGADTTGFSVRIGSSIY